MSGPEAARRKAQETCTFCPKACRFACPVSEATQNETTSTWAKMTTAHLAHEKQRPIDAVSAKALYACTGCMRCRTFCKHDNEVGLALFNSRGLALEAEVAPKGAKSTVETFETHGNPFGKDFPLRAHRVLERAAAGPVSALPRLHYAGQTARGD